MMKTTFSRALLAGVIAIAVTPFAFAATLTVTSNADSGEGTLRELINTCASGDTIEIPEGMEIKIESVMSRTNATVTVKGIGTGATINGQGKTPFYFFRTTWGQVRTFSMENLTFTNCTAATGGVIKSNGGGTQGTNHYRAKNCRFYGNSATTSGGVLANGADWVIEDCYFVGNAAPAGGVFPCLSATLYVTNSFFWHNTASKGAVIGDTAQYPQPSGNLYAYGCDFSCNVATNGGGAFANKVFKNQDIRFCTFTNNTSSSGVVVFDQAASTSTSVLYEDSVMARNTSGGEGGIFGNSCNSPIPVRRCKVSNNTSARCSVGGGTGLSQHLKFEHCLLETNIATTAAGWYSCGMFGYNARASKLEFDNCIIRGNANAGGGNGVLIWFYNPTTNNWVKLKRSLIEGNYSNSNVSLFEGSNFQLEIDDCTFKDNGISPDGVRTNTVLMKLDSCPLNRHVRNCTFVGNWGKGQKWQSNGLVQGSLASTLDADGNPVSFLDIDHCTFVSNYMLKTESSGPTLFINSAKTSGTRITNCAFADNFDTAGAALAIKEGTEGTTAMTNCMMTSTTTLTNIKNVEQSVASASFKFRDFGDNGITNTLYGTEKLPTLAIARRSCLVDAGIGALATDERGFARDAKPDIGAFEYISPIGLKIILR